MIVNAEKTRESLKHLLTSAEKVNAKFGVSRKRKQDFKKACEIEGFKKFSPVLEDLLEQINECYFVREKVFKIEVEGFTDRAPSTSNCYGATWEIFNKGCKNAGHRIGNTIEFIMAQYIAQVEAKHGIKIKN